MTITAENLGKRFNREWIFRNFNYSFQEGVYAITGPNGSGKSTFLQVLWGQLPASTGTLRYHQSSSEILIEDIYPRLVIAAPYMILIEEFTLMELLKFHFSIKRIRGNKSVEEVLDLLELPRARNKQIVQFSSGMKQRVKLGLAFYTEADMVFLDEPTTNLDKKSIEWYWRNFDAFRTKNIVFIGSNLENEYPADSVKIHIPNHK